MTRYRKNPALRRNPAKLRRFMATLPAPTHKESTVTKPKLPLFDSGNPDLGRQASEMFGSAPDLHAVFATDGQHDTYRVSDPLDHAAALAEWNKLDELRRDGRMPHVKFYEVRSVTLGPDRPIVGPEIRSHDRYDRAPLKPTLARPVVPSRGYTNVKGVARSAWKSYYPTYSSRYDRKAFNPDNLKTGVQGLGGWYFYSNGQTAAQGLDDLVKVAQRMGMIVQGVNGRWYIVAQEQL